MGLQARIWLTSLFENFHKKLIYRKSFTQPCLYFQNQSPGNLKCEGAEPHVLAISRYNGQVAGTKLTRAYRCFITPASPLVMLTSA